MRGKHPSKDNIWNASIHKGRLDMWPCGSGQSLSTNSREANRISIKGHTVGEHIFKWGDTSGWFLGSFNIYMYKYFMYLKYIKAFQDHLRTLNSGAFAALTASTHPLRLSTRFRCVSVGIFAHSTQRTETDTRAPLTISAPGHPKGGWWVWSQEWVNSSTPNSCNHPFLDLSFTKLEP